MDLFLPVTLFLSIILTTFNRGFFSFPAIGILLCLYGILLIFFFKRTQNGKPKTYTSDIFPYLFIVNYILFLFFSGGIYQTRIVPSYLLSFLPIFALPLVLTYSMSHSSIRQKQRKLRFFFLLSLALILRILIIIASPHPIIDVFTMLKEAPLALLNGQNPYDSVFSQVYPGVTSDYFTYWPVSFLLQLPFIALFGDPRFLLALADIGSAWLIYILGDKSKTSQLFSLIYLFRPNSNFIIEQSYLVPLEFFFFALTVYIFKIKKVSFGIKKELLYGIFIGILTGIKPYYLALLPFFLLRKARYVIAGFLLIILIAVVPFILWNPSLFKADTIDYFLRSTGQISYVPIFRSLNMNTLIQFFTGFTVPLLYSTIVLLLISALIYYKSLTRIQDTEVKHETIFLQHTLLGTIIFFFSFYIFLRFAFINYYYFISGLIILWEMEFFLYD